MFEPIFCHSSNKGKRAKGGKGGQNGTWMWSGKDQQIPEIPAK
jgi:mono/diheme cytochrome c family protein